MKLVFMGTPDFAVGALEAVVAAGHEVAAVVTQPDKPKARNVGFDWDEREQVWDKVYEEIGELKAEFERGDKEKALRELGDFIFAVVNAARLYHLNPDTALEKTNRKFIRRFNHIEARAREMGKELKDMTLAEMDALWDEAKTVEE